METNYQMLKKLNEAYTPARYGIVTTKEMIFIGETLCLDKMDILQLRNLRDETVMFFSLMKDDSKDVLEIIDKMSAITAVIDQKIVVLGGEV